MKLSLKKLSEQVIVITGASSGIGLATAREAAKRGAKVVLAARNGEALQQITDDLNKQGYQTLAVVTDVSKEDQVRALAAAAIARFGDIDTWVNNAGVSVFGHDADVPLDDQRRLFDTNFWGVVHGSRVAVEHFRFRGGALINLGSEVSDTGIPLQGVYAASKHAIKGYTDSLRMELELADTPISVTLIKPGAIDTMFVPHAGNYMDVEPKLPAPIYAPEIVADAILFAAEHPRRDVFIGAAAKLSSASAYHAPRLSDRIMGAMGFKGQRTDRPNTPHQGSLHTPGEGGRQSQGQESRVNKSSVYTKLALRPQLTGLAVVGAGVILGALVAGRRRRPQTMLARGKQLLTTRSF